MRLDRVGRDRAGRYDLDREIGLATALGHRAGIERYPSHTHHPTKRIVEGGYHVYVIGSDTQLEITMPYGAKIRVYDQNDLSTVDEDYFYQAGDQAWISWRPENALVLKD